MEQMQIDGEDESVEEDEGVGSKRHRSPPYPTISFPKAEGYIKDIYSQVGRSVFGRENGCKIMGFSRVNGTSGGVLAALKKFGLATGNGKLQLTSEAISIATWPPGHDPEGLLRLRRKLAIKPSIFAALQVQFSSKGTRRSIVQHWLVSEKQYNENAAQKLVTAWMETCDALWPDGHQEDEDEAVEAPQVPVEQAPVEVRRGSELLNVTVPTADGSGMLRVAVTSTSPISDADVTRIRSMVDLIVVA